MIRSGSMMVLAFAMLQGCASAPPPPPEVKPEPPTVVNLTIDSAADSNAEAGKAGAPVMLRIYQLRGSSAFNAADFFSLFEKDQATLGADMAQKQEIMLKPKGQESITLQVEPEIKSLGIFAAFRQLDTAQWRAMVPVKAHQTQSAVIKLKANILSVEPAAPDKKGP